MPLLLTQIDNVVRVADFKAGAAVPYNEQTRKCFKHMMAILKAFDIPHEDETVQLYGDFLCLHFPEEKVK